MNTKYNINLNYFKSVDTEGKAYFLGLLYADGGLCDSEKKVYLRLIEQDKEILEKFKEELETDIPLKYIYKKHLGENWNNMYLLRICRKEIWNDLHKWGLYQNKSLTITPDKIQNLSDDLFRHFLRGYFDGDGCIGVYKPNNRKTYQSAVSILSTMEMLKFFEHKIQHLNLNIRYSKRKKNLTNCYTLEINGNNQVKTFMNFLYYDSKFFLSRKRNKYFELLQLFKTGTQKTIRHNQKINQLAQNNQIINVFFSLTEVSKFLKISIGRISNVLKNAIEVPVFYKGYYWQKIV